MMTRRKTPLKLSWRWQDDAACGGEDLVRFFGPDGERQPERDLRERKAKAVCTGCPVRGDCLGYALGRPEKYGTWAGLNEDERAGERRRRQRRGDPMTVDEPEVDEPDDPGKECSACKRVWPLSDFHRDARTPDGLAYHCRFCVGAARLRRRLEQQADTDVAVAS